MTVRLSTILLNALLILAISACTGKEGKTDKWAIDAVNVASIQLKELANQCAESGKLPRSIGKNNKVRLENKYDWTSGFFPGTLWYQYELTGDSYFREQAEYYTSLLYEVKDFKDTHDLGFMMYCSYGNQNRIAPNDTIAPLLISTADNLIARFNPEIKAIRSWDFGEWNYPVIIDNMMNLELLFWASDYSGNPKYKEIALTHANTTLQHHFREDMSSYHVVSYHDDGTVESKGTFQGYADDSDWARGQAWALYGYVVSFRATKDPTYLKAAQDIAELIIYQETMPTDQIPYWDFDAIDIPNAPRDVSAASITASALLELSTLVEEGAVYFDQAELILKNLSKPPYLAEGGTNHGFLLKHATGHLPANSEIDTSLNYADYYYIEALKRYFDITDIKYPFSLNN